MELRLISLRKSINKAYLKEVVDRPSFNRFKSALAQLIENVDAAAKRQEHEEHFKNFLSPFLNETGFEDYFINTSGRIDLAIHNGSSGKDPVGVLVEVKRPSNKNEMITAGQLNRKALHEAVLYYLEQRIEAGNSDLKHIIITNMWQWFVFDAQEFERCFYSPATLRKTYTAWKADQKVSSNNAFMYEQIAGFIAGQDATLKGVQINLQEEARYLKAKEDSTYEKKLIPLYKFFSPVQLLKMPFANDSNTLNREFYRELLYILGLEETKDGSTRYIERVGSEDRQQGSLIENTIRILESENRLSQVSEREVRYGKDSDDQLFNVAMELCITWINRILFLKLLEAQLFRYHRQAKAFKFLHIGFIDDYDELNKLFFQVLAKKEDDRPADITEKYGHIPYLNSSLFDVSRLEYQTIVISGLDDHAGLPVYARSVLAGQKGKSLNTLEYLFRFLDAYDFSAEKGEEIREERKTLINASVLGLIFEKINGYKDGSFYTPGFITEYMARETLRKAVVDKFATLSPSPSPSGGRGVSEGRGEGENTEEAHTPGNSNRVEEPGWKLPDSLIAAARELRQKQTEAEELLWQLLRNRQLNNAKFRRQHPIREGFILDFYCHQARLAVEVDGGYHATKEQQAADAERTEHLNEMGIRVIRFWNKEVLEETERVLREIARALEASAPSLPSPAGGRGMSAGQGEGGLSLTDIYNRIGRDISMEQANEIINSITICDPAVGSGHFLVSCLNELLAIKSELGILCDADGKRLRDVKVTVENDELIVTTGDEELFEYDVAATWSGKTLSRRKVAPERQRVQQTLFREKRHIIENGLFGVDINANSVKICRLRLWIELLKRAYYTEESNYMKLEVLPNIDINIKQGNSLVSRFGLDSDLSTVFTGSEHSLADYKEAVRSYKHTGNRAEKQRLQQLIDDIKAEYSTTLTNNRPINKKLSKQRGRLELMQNADLFGDQKFTREEIKKQEKKVQQLEEQKAEEEAGAFYNQAFEWRFEFPEALDDDGRFTGFDLVIGNPPYIRQEELKEQKEYFKTHYEVYQGTADLYSYFIERGMNLLRPGGLFHYIVSNKWMRANYGKSLRKWMQQYQIDSIIDFGDLQVFEEATTYPCLLQLRKAEINTNFKATQIEHLDFENLPIYLINNQFEVDQTKLQTEGWALVDKWSQALLEKLKQTGIPLGKYIDEKIYRGVVTGLNEAFIIDEEQKQNLIEQDKKSVEVIYPVLKGRDVKRYSPLKSDNYLIYLERNCDLKEFPAIKDHLETYRGNLEPKPKDWQGNKWQGRASGNYKWFETQSAFSNYEEWLKPKIIYPDLSNRCEFTIDRDGEFLGVNTTYVIASDELALLGILNSSLIEFFYQNISSSYRGGYLRFFTQYVETIPIIVEQKDLKEKIESLVDQILTAKRNDPEADTSKLEAEIDRLVYELYGLNEEEIAIVEGKDLEC